LQHLARMKVLSSTFNLKSISDLQCLQRYRFTRKDVRFLADLIPWGKRLDHEGRMTTFQKRYLVDPVEATAIMQRRLATASRWVDLEPEFGKHRSALSEIFYHALELFYSEFGSSLETWPESLVALRARECAKSVDNKGSPLDSVVASSTGLESKSRDPEGPVRGPHTAVTKDITVSSSKQSQLRMGWFSIRSVP
jgi:hypothetical protein